MALARSIKAAWDEFPPASQKTVIELIKTMDKEKDNEPIMDKAVAALKKTDLSLSHRFELLDWLVDQYL